MKNSLKALMLAFLVSTGISAPAFSQDTSSGLSPEFNASAPYTHIDTLKNGDIVHLRTGTHVTKDQMMDDIDNARVIYISEIHDNVAAHEAQLAIIKEFYERHPGKITVSMEMFRRSAQKELNRLEKGALSQKELNRLFDKDWTSDWREAYQPILNYMYDHSIPVIGLKPDKGTEALVRSGKTGPNVPELDLNDPYHRELYMSFFGKHGSPEIAERMYRMMVLWDEAMAARVDEFLQNPKNKDKKLIVIAGIGHIGYGFGIPKRAFRRSPHSYSVITPIIGEDPQKKNLPLLLGDYAWKVPYDRLGAKPPLLPKP